ncbi:hypothetical protein YC2023_033142 [Brassica napus]
MRQLITELSGNEEGHSHNSECDWHCSNTIDRQQTTTIARKTPSSIDRKPPGRID